MARKSRKAIKPRKSSRKGSRKARKSSRKGSRKARKSSRKGSRKARKSNRKGSRKARKSNRKGSGESCNSSKSTRVHHFAENIRTYVETTTNRKELEFLAEQVFGRYKMPKRLATLKKYILSVIDIYNWEALMLRLKGYIYRYRELPTY